MSDLRRVEKKVGEVWEAIDIWALEKGDIFRMFQDNELVGGKNYVVAVPRQSYDGVRGVEAVPYGA